MQQASALSLLALTLQLHTNAEHVGRTTGQWDPDSSLSWFSAQKQPRRALQQSIGAASATPSGASQNVGTYVVIGIAFLVAASLLLLIWNFARLLSRHGRQQREFLAELAEHDQQHERGEDGGAAPKAPQEAVKVVLMPDGGYAVAVEVGKVQPGSPPSPVLSPLGSPLSARSFSPTAIFRSLRALPIPRGSLDDSRPGGLSAEPRSPPVSHRVAPASVQRRVNSLPLPAEMVEAAIASAGAPPQPRAVPQQQAVNAVRV